MQTSMRKKAANRAANIEYGSFTPLEFQADYEMCCYFREALKPLADTFFPNRNMNAAQ